MFMREYIRMDNKIEILVLLVIYMIGYRIGFIVGEIVIQSFLRY